MKLSVCLRNTGITMLNPYTIRNLTRRGLALLRTRPRITWKNKTIEQSFFRNEEYIQYTDTQVLQQLGLLKTASLPPGDTGNSNIMNVQKITQTK